MRITKGIIRVQEIPLRVPFRTALRATTSVTDIRLVLETDEGLLGLGSASPTPAITGETTESIVSAMQNYILPGLEGVPLEDPEDVFARLRRAIVKNHAAKAAVDIAIHDLYAKQQGVPLTAYFGAPGKQSVLTDATVSLASVEDMERQSRSLVNGGFSVLKVKLGGRDGSDMERLRRIRTAVGADVTIRVDANQAWSVDEAIRYMDEMMICSVELVEQPVPAFDVKGLAAIQSGSPIPIAADESVYVREDVERIIEERAAQIINIKLMKAGGLFEARRMVEKVRNAGLQFMVGSMMEGVISVTAAAQFAAAYHCPYVDLDAAYFLASEDVVGGVSYQEQTIRLPRGAGVGVSYRAEGEVAMT